MRRFLAVLLGICAVGQAQTAGTHIADLWVDGGGNPLSGAVSVSWPSFTTAAGRGIPAGSASYSINSGVINIYLQPTVGSSTNAVYTATFYDPAGAVETSETWSVPVTSSTLTLGAISCPGVAGCPSTSTGTGSTSGLATPAFTGIPYFTSGQTASMAANAGNVIGLFGSITSHWVFAAPSSGAGAPGFRALVASDIPALSYQFPLSFTGPPGIVATSLGGHTVNDCVKWDAYGNAVDAGAPCGGSLPSGAANLFLATPNGSSGISGLRAIVAADLPSLSYQSPLSFTGNGTKTASSLGTYTANDCAKWDSNGNVVDSGASCAGGGTGGSGTVDSATAGQFAFYSVNGAIVGGHTLVAGDIPALSYQTPLTFTGSGSKTASSTGTLTANDCAKFDASGNVVDAGAGCGTATLPSGAAHLFIATPSGSSGASGLRAIVAGDIPALSYQTPLTFTGPGSKTASSTGTTTANDCAKWDSSGNVIDAGAGCGGYASSPANYVVATPNGISGVPSPRALVAGDIPALGYQSPLTFTGNGANTASSAGGITTNDCAKWDSNGNVVDSGAPCGSGGGSGPSTPGSTTVGNVPQYSNTTGTALSAGLGVVTTVGSPGLNSNLPTEEAVNTAINAALTSSGNLPTQTGTAGYLTTNGTSVSWGNIESGGSGAIDCATVLGVCDIVTAIVPLKPAYNLWSGQNVLTGGPAIQFQNATLTGTSQWHLVKLTGAPSTAVIAATSDTTNIIGIAVDGAFGAAAGTVYVILSGSTNCAFDGTTIAGDWVQISSTVGGACHDTGSATRPVTHQIIGRVLSTNSVAGTYAIILEQDGQQ